MAVLSLSASRVRELFDYDPATGLLTRRIAVSNSRVGVAVGRDNGLGYLQVRVDRRLFTVHRVIWCWMTGEWPQGEVDHIDGNRSNNRWSNLRLATREQNEANKRTREGKIGGAKGVYAHRGRWRALITVAGKRIYLGVFDRHEDAVSAYAEAATKHYGAFAKSDVRSDGEAA
jgi:hypothetical protein